VQLIATFIGVGYAWLALSLCFSDVCLNEFMIFVGY